MVSSPGFDHLGGLRWLVGGENPTFSEYGHVVYQIKGNEVYNNMLANVKRSKIYFSSESSHVTYQSKKNGS